MEGFVLGSVARRLVNKPKIMRILRAFCSVQMFALFALLASGHSSSAETIVVDITGRRVELAAPAKRILLDAPAYYPALPLLDRNAEDLIVGVSNSPSGRDFGPGSEMLRDLIGKPRIGSIWARTFSIEKALELKPDLLIASSSARGQAASIEEAFGKVGIPVVYVDFSADPAKKTPASIKIIGQAIGAEEKAAEIVDFYDRHVSRITDRLKSAGLTRPKLLVMSRGPGLRCCFASPDTGVIAYFGGLGITNIAGRMGPTGSAPSVQLSLEYIIEHDPEVFVVNAIGKGADSIFGEPPTVAQGVASLEKLRSEPGFRDLSAVRSGRVHAIDLSLLISPLNFLAFEALAKWVHPDTFGDLDPQATLDEINRRFLKTPLKGPFWTSLDPAPDRPSGGRR